MLLVADKPQVNVFFAHLGECVLADKPQPAKCFFGLSSLNIFY